MKILIEVPVETDGELGIADDARLRQHLRQGLSNLREQLRDAEILSPEPRILGTVCRFRFGRPEIRMED